MAPEAVKATTRDKVSGDKCEVGCSYDFGDNLAEAVSKFGEDIVFNKFKQASVVDLQHVIRPISVIHKDDPVKAAELAQKKADEWKPGMQVARVVDPLGKLLEKFPSMSPEEQAKTLERLEAIKAKLAG